MASDWTGLDARPGQPITVNGDTFEAIAFADIQARVSVPSEIRHSYLTGDPGLSPNSMATVQSTELVVTLALTALF